MKRHWMNSYGKKHHHEKKKNEPMSSSSSSFSEYYGGVWNAKFCSLDWRDHEQDPTKTYMFRDVITTSHCREPNQTHSIDFYTIVQAVREYDHNHNKNNKNNKNNNNNVHTAHLAGVVFHESRCGSTLIANLLQWHSPDENIVYSEALPLLQIMTALGTVMMDQEVEEEEEKEEFSSSTRSLSSSSSSSFNTIQRHPTWTIQILHDVVYLMSRTNRILKKRVFFKVQSIGTLFLSYFRQAYPQTPWMFVFRDPIEVLMSHLQHGMDHATCLSTYHHDPNDDMSHDDDIPPYIMNVIQKFAPSSLQGRTTTNLSPEEYCAAHLASLTETAAYELSLEAMAATQNNAGSSSPLLSFSYGIAVNYQDLPNLLIHEIWPKLWNLYIPNDETRQRVEQGSLSYSKSGQPQEQEQVQQKFHGDSQSKQNHATNAMKHAAMTFLQPSFVYLEQMSIHTKQELGVSPKFWNQW